MEIVEYSKTEAALATLREKFKGVVYDVAKREGMAAAREARAEVKGYRVALEKLRVEIKAPALERCQAIDAEARRITRELSAIEDPIDAQIKAEEARVLAEKTAKERAEREAKEAEERKAREAEAARIAEERAAIERERAKLEAEKKAAADAIEAQQRAAREKIEAEQRAARLAIEEAERAARMEREAAERAARALADAEAARLREIENAARMEREKADAERRAIENAKRIEAEAIEAKKRAEAAEAQRIADAARREEERKHNELCDLRGMLETFSRRAEGIEEFADVVKAIEAYFVNRNSNVCA